MHFNEVSFFSESVDKKKNVYKPKDQFCCPGTRAYMFDDFHCLLSSLATLVVRAHLLSQDFEAVNAS